MVHETLENIFVKSAFIFNRHLKLLCLGSKEFEFSFMFWIKIEAALNVLEFALFVSWILQELLYLGPEQREGTILLHLCSEPR